MTGKPEVLWDWQVQQVYCMPVSQLQGKRNRVTCSYKKKKKEEGEREKEKEKKKKNL